MSEEGRQLAIFRLEQQLSVLEGNFRYWSNRIAEAERERDACIAESDKVRRQLWELRKSAEDRQP